MTNPIEEAQRHGQSIWYDNISRGLLTSGEMDRLIQLGVTGVTSNPTIFEKAIAGSTDYDEGLMSLAHEGKGVVETYEALAMEDIRVTADLLRPVYDSTDGADGYVSFEVSPSLAHNTEGTVQETKRLFAALQRPNVMVKVPATPEGVPAIQALIGQGININVTLIFSLESHLQVMEAYTAGLEDLDRSGGDVHRVVSVASFFVSRVDTAVDAQLDELIRQGREELRGLLGKAATANAKLAYRKFEAVFGGQRFARLEAKGARVQRPLWASTGTKNPTYSDLLYVETLIGSNTVNTMPPATLTAFQEHGSSKSTIRMGVEEAGQTIAELEAAGISMDQVTGKLLEDGVKSFADSFDKLMANIDEKRVLLLKREHVHPEASLGPLMDDVEVAITDVEQREVERRIWSGDHTVWKQDPTEITNRLGWLTVTDTMIEQAPALEVFGREVRDQGFRHVVLLGMGGSSLGPDVLRHTFGSAEGYPQLIVLDSTVPDSVLGVTAEIDPSHTLFLVSSKSGDTAETSSYYRYFRDMLNQQLGEDKARDSFVAITDGGTPLETLAQKEGFRRIFINPSNIGGRYSVLSYFGLVPAALIGLDVAELLDRADGMREGCPSCVPPHSNPGTWLGTLIGSLAKGGRDKLTLVTSPVVASFGLWVEQLIAESTGKEGKGIIPVAGEPLSPPERYGDDRLFVYMRFQGDNNAATDAAIEALISSGQLVLRMNLRDRYDLGAEFFRWEFATAVAGSLLNIHPFDQPDVQGAKNSTARLLQEYRKYGRLPTVEIGDSLAALLTRAVPGDYLAFMPYLRQTEGLDQALAELRQSVMKRYRIATTVGYGPRFLHSTGQLHKGGPGSGLYLQVTADHEVDVSIPGEPHTFGVLVDAQALGDLQALQSAGRRVVRVRVGTDYEEGIRSLASEIA